MADDPYKYFRIEGRELAESLGKGVLELEKGVSTDVVGRMLRHAHTLKGAARVVRQPAIADCAHSIEEVLGPLRGGASRIEPEQITRLLTLVDTIAARLTELSPVATPSSTPADAPPVAPEPPLVIRTEIGEMDALLNGLVETNARVGALRAPVDSLARIEHLVEALGPEELRELIQRCGREFTTSIEHVNRELIQVRELAEQLRLAPVASLFMMLERTARDAAQALGKRVTFEGRGGDVRLDSTVLSLMQDSLVQLVRNAVAHGIERAGRVSVEVVRRGQRAVFRCRDDGRGLDVDAIRRAATRRGIAVPDTLDASALVSLLLRGGISTSSHVTEVAGRGIGLDVLRAAAEKLGAEVRVETARGSGTTFEISVPISLASLETLTLDVGGRTIAIPLDAVRACRAMGPGDVSSTPGGEQVIHDARTIPLLRLSSVLGAGSAPRSRKTFVAVVIETEGRRAAVAVDGLRGTWSVILRSIPEVAGVDAIVGGAAFDPLGNPELVLDPDQLVAAAYRERSLQQPQEARRISVLVIDDSVTTRMLEQSILESAGYDVDTAVSGEDGLDAARRKRYALFLVDVEMPGIDGFTFVERVRGDAALREIPAILVTSRAATADRLRGEQVGAQGYMVKSEFDQVSLLARIEELVRGHA